MLVENMYVKESYFSSKKNAKKVEGARYGNLMMQDNTSPSTELEPIWGISKMDYRNEQF